MANHKATKKDSRQNEKRRVHNKYYKKTTRNAIKQIKEEKDITLAEASLGNVISMIDKLAKRKMIHKNKAINLKSKLAKRLNKQKTAPVADATQVAPKKASTAKPKKVVKKKTA